MKKEIAFVGLDVDSKAYHGYLLSKSGEKQAFITRSDIGVLIKKLRRFEKTGFSLRVCYEAAFPGLIICRKLREAGFHCDAIAPSLTPRRPSSRVKTDRVDAKKLAEYYSQGLLVPVYVPNEQDEKVRDLLRSRRFLVEKQKAIRKHIVSLCYREGLDYKREVSKPGANYWTTPHKEWLEGKIGKLESEVQQLNFLNLIHTADLLAEKIRLFEDKIEQIAQSPNYKKRVGILCSFRGIGTLLALTIVTEIGNIGRFSHPNKLVSYIGLDVTERSSGGQEKKFGVSKMGNPTLRTAAVESCQFAYRNPRLSRHLRKRREGVAQDFVDVADRCMSRLYKKGSRLIYRGKHTNKAKVACARELMCFIWEALTKAA